MSRKKRHRQQPPSHRQKTTSIHNATTGPPTTGPPPSSRRRRWAFRLIALSLPILVLLLFEIICRIAGYGGYPAILKHLRAVDGRTYVGSYQAGMNTFFRANLTQTGNMREQVFVTPKDRNTLRLVLVGGSAMRGYPQPRMLAASSFLQAMLSDLLPDRNIEVLNFGTTAIASFPVMYVVDEALRYEPDLVIVYSGNNEFYGAHGVASVHSFGRSTTAMQLTRMARRSALVQWLTNLTASVTDAAMTPEESDLTLMERVIADSQIGPDDSARAAAARNLDNHLRSMIRQCHEQHVPVIVCTLPANERDIWPIGEDVTPDLPADQLAAFEAHVAEGEALLETRPAEAVQQLLSALDLYDHRARSHFLLARALAALERHDEAQQEYLAARQLDTMPWRAPTSFNDVVRQAAGQPGATLCDLEETFQDASPGGAIGWELMDDHVHPSLRGQAQIAEAWIRTMADLSPPLHIESTAAAALADWRTYAQRLGSNRFDTYASAQRMVNLFQAPFYRRSNPKGLQRFEARLDEIEADFSPIERAAARHWQNPKTHQYGARPIAGIAGAGLMGDGQFEEADRLLCIARRNVARYSLWNLELTWKALQCRRRLRSLPEPDDIALAEQLIRDGETLYRATGVSNPALHRHLGLTYNLLGEHDRAIKHLSKSIRYVKDMSQFNVVRALINSLVTTGQIDRARRVLEAPPRNRQLREACNKLLANLDLQQPSLTP